MTCSLMSVQSLGTLTGERAYSLLGSFTTYSKQVGGVCIIASLEIGILIVPRQYSLRGGGSC